MIQAGRLDRRVTLQRPVDTRDEAGTAREVWVPVAEVWAQKRDLRGREFFAAQASQAEVDTMFVIRAPEAVPSPRWRVLDGAAAFDILAVAEIGRAEGYELRCSRIVEADAA